jgi:hypothetical protein
MILRKLRHVVVALVTLGAPLAAVAQPLPPGGTVTTSPFGGTAPAMGMPLLALLVVVLAGSGVYLLRRTGGGTIAKMGFVAALTAMAGLGYAILVIGVTIPIEGIQCMRQTVQTFDPTAENTLVSRCPNQIQIVSIQVVPCPGFDPLGSCSEGQVLADGDACTLPTCVPPS